MKNSIKLAYVVLAVLLPFFFLPVAMCQEPDLEYIIESSNFNSEWRIEEILYADFADEGESRPTIEDNGEYTTIVLAINQYTSHYHGLDLLGIFSKAEKDPVDLRLQVRVDASDLPSNWSAVAKINEHFEWKNGGKLEIDQGTENIWHAITGRYNEESLKKFYLSISLRVLEDSYSRNPSGKITFHIKNFSSDQNLNRHNLKGKCNNCDRTWDCKTGYDCMGYSTVDDPFTAVFGKCEPEGSTGDPCGVTGENDDLGCFLNGMTPFSGKKLIRKD